MKPIILFICLGNIMRSQMAQGFYNHLTKSKLANSAGNDVYTSRIYQYPHPEATEVMKELGIDISNQPVTLITPEMAKQAKHIYILCKPDECQPFLLEEGKGKITFWDIPDPHGFGIDYTRKVRDMIKKKVKGIV